MTHWALQSELLLKHTIKMYQEGNPEFAVHPDFYLSSEINETY